MKITRALAMGTVVIALAALGALLAWRRGSASEGVRHVVLISIDTCRADRLGCYGGNRHVTPNIDALSAHAALFENVISPVPMTLPAHCSLLTGATPLRHGVHDNFGYRLDLANTTLAELLEKRGYVTGAFVSSFVLDAKFGMNQGFATYDDQLPDKRTIFGNLSERRAEDTTALACTWIDAQRESPFFLFVHYYDPHAAYEPPEPFAARFRDDPYAGEIAYVDACIGRLLDQLRSAGLYDSSLVVITADHGEMLGEHGERTHSYFVYQSAVRVPLLFKLPGAQAGQRLAGVVGLIDVAPTICGLAGVVAGEMDGEDLSPRMRRGSAPEAERFLYSESFTPLIYDANPLQALVGRRWKYISGNRPELYDWLADPAETVNQVDAEAEVAADLRDRLMELARVPQLDGKVDATALNDLDRRQLEALGYVAIGHANDATGIDPRRSDPKDRIEFHENVKRLAVLVAERQFEEAERLAARLLEIWPGFQRGHVIRARIALDRGDAESAEEHVGAALALDPLDADALNLLGNIRFAEGAGDAAIAQYREALQQDASSAQAHIGLGIALASREELKEAIQHFRAALDIDPRLAEAHHNLALALVRRGATDEAVGHFRDALRHSPRMVEAHIGLGLALESRGELPEAARCFRQALDLDPKRSEANHNLGTVLARQGQYAEAIESFREALRLNPNYAHAHNNMAVALRLTGRSAEALPHFREALRLSPDWLEPLNSAAWILATHPTADVRAPAEAIRLAERAVDISRRANASVLDTLAAAYAADGDFEQAQATADEALVRAEQTGDEAQAREIRARLALYQLRQPFIQAAPADPPP